MNDNKITRNRLFWILAVICLVAVVFWQLRVKQPAVLVSGKPVAYWLENLPRETFASSLLPDNNPLALAGSEIIPSLVHEIEHRPAVRDYINGNRWRLPAFLQKRLPKQGAPNSVIRTVAAFRLGQFGPAASNAVPCLVTLLKKPAAYAGDRGRLIQALGFIGPQSGEAVPLLAESLNDTNQWIRMTAAHSLLEIGVVPPAAIPALKRNLADVGHIAAWMAVALWVADPSPETLSRVELMLTKNGDGNTREHVAAALGFVREIPNDLKPILTRMLEESNPSVRQGAAIALARPHAENPERIVAVLIEGLKSGQFQIPCAQALGRMGPEAANALADLNQTKGYVLRNAAAHARAKILTK